MTSDDDAYRVAVSTAAEQIKMPRSMVAELNAIELTEDGIARAFAERYRERLRFDHTRGLWYLWDGTRWAEENTRLAFDWARDLCREYNQREKDRVLPKVKTAEAVEKFAQADRRLACTHELWDQDPYLLATPAGTVALKTGELLENNHTDFITKVTTVAPDDMMIPAWWSFLEQATCGDSALQRFLQQIAGYVLTGDTSEHALFFLYGPGGNGKSTFVNALASIMGDYAVTASMDTFVTSKYDRHPTELAWLRGGRMVTASETEEGRAWAESRIKQLTGGDPIAARYMRRDFFEYLPQFKLLFQGNHKPVLHNVDEAARRRFHIIPFTNKPKKPDKKLPEELKPEYPGILHWAIEGCLDWQSHGLIVPEVVREETEAYFETQDTFSQWLVECTEQKYETTGEPSSRLYGSWKDYAQRQGEDPGTSKRFSERLVGAGYRKVKNTPGHHGQRGFVGIALKVEHQEYQPYAD